MRLCDRYLFNELITPFFVGTFIVLMMLVGSWLYNVLEPMFRNNWPLEMVVRGVILNVPSSLVLALPVSTAIAASLTVNRMARDNEFIVLRSTGVPLWRMFVPVVIFGFLTSVLNLWISNQVVPWAFREQQNVESYMSGIKASPVELSMTIPVPAERKTVTFRSAQKVEGKERRYRLNNVLIVEQPDPMKSTGKPQYPLITTVDTAEYENGEWFLKGVAYHHYNENGLTEMDVTAAEGTLQLRIDFSGMYQMPQGEQFDKLSFEELTRRAAEAARYGNKAEARTMEVERWFKLSLPMMGVVLVLCGVPLSLRFARTGAFTGVLLSIITIFVGWNTLLLMKYVAFGGLLPPVVAAWSTNILFLVLGLWLLNTQE
ncbi:MAG: LPS export ABC transporter permease LptG [Armatimonadaceae bacterium]